MKALVTEGSAAWTCIFVDTVACAQHACKPGTICRLFARASAVPDDLKCQDYVDKRLPKPQLKSPLKKLRKASDWEEIEKIMGHRYTRQELINIMEGELSRFGGRLGLDMMKHFLNGLGRPLTHTNHSYLGRLVQQSEAYRRGHRSVLSTIQKNVARSRKMKVQLGSLLGAPTKSFPLAGFQPQYDMGIADAEWIEWPLNVKKLLFSSSYAQLAAVLGGTKGNKAFVRNLKVVPRGDSVLYQFDLRIEICDHFGVDATDLYTPALCAFWMLQHAVPGTQRSFVNLVVIEETVSVIV